MQTLKYSLAVQLTFPLAYFIFVLINAFTILGGNSQ